MSFSSVEIFIGVVSIIIGIYYYLTANFNFWKSRGVPGPKPIPIFGNIYDLISIKYSIGCYLKNIYDNNYWRNEKFVGIFTTSEPVLIIKDLDLIKTVLIKDFNFFSDRGAEFNESVEPINNHLFNLESKRWRPLRAKLTPVFTSGKLREMFYLLNECADQLDEYLNKFNGKIVDMREISARFTTDVIGVCAFGLQANSLVDDDCMFRKMGKRIFSFEFKAMMRHRLRSFAPFLYNYIGKYFADNVLDDFFVNLTVDTMNYRRDNNINRHDFIDLLKSLKEEPSKIDDIELTDTMLAAQLFIFFIAGFETSSSTMSNCLLELGMNHQLRDKLRREIKNELDNADGKITYEGIKNMKYLDKIIKETLRKYPPLTTLMRKSTAPYTLPGTNVTIPTGTKILIPIYAIQRDPTYFPNPNEFDPERFNDEAVKSRHPMSFLSFGDGPRNCIGARFGSMQTKVGIVKILEKYTVDICDKTDKDFKINPRGALLTPQNGIYLKITKTPIV
ncbi:probable cytochrome P450 6a14 [Aphidius gifuensis]|uniref:probable cytochrome P450 6a14 n=1 Tax=Aphidius gifuensis TaxID=684658 RepID=UPI001CDCE5F0|nr:probable cytochrome P450 6a14 [Aphidius gifuensis]